MDKSLHFSSLNQNWETPREFFDEVNKRFKFKWDLACTSDNCLCPYGIYHDYGLDALTENWNKLDGWLWVNPPYDRGLKKWVKKAYDEYQAGAKIVMFIPARPDTSYWHDFILETAKVEFIRGRIVFKGATQPAPFPSALVIYGDTK